MDLRAKVRPIITFLHSLQTSHKNAVLGSMVESPIWSMPQFMTAVSRFRYGCRNSQLLVMGWETNVPQGWEKLLVCLQAYHQQANAQVWHFQQVL